MIDARDTASPFGAGDYFAWNHPWNQHHYPLAAIDTAARQMRDAGVAMVRSEFLWTDIEPEPGRFEFDKYDAIVDLLCGHQLKMMGLLVYTAPSTGLAWNDAPPPDAYAEFARRVVARYKDRIRHWEIWNEPDHWLFWNPQDGMRGYTELLQTVYGTLKAEDVSCLVHLAGLTNTVPLALKQVYESGGQDFFDIAHLHPFIDPQSPGAFEAVRHLYRLFRQTMEQYGDGDKPVWFSTVACPGVRQGHHSPDWWLGQNPTEEEQAKWVDTLYDEALRWPGLEKIFWSHFRDANGFFGHGVDHFGLLRHDLSPKPGLDAYRRRARAWADHAAVVSGGTARRSSG